MIFKEPDEVNDFSGLFTKESLFSKEELNVMWQQLYIKDEDRIPECAMPVISIFETVVNTMSNIFQEIRLSNDVKYLSLSLLEAFLNRESEYRFTQQEALWTENFKKITKYAPIYALTCIVIASKFDSSQNYITPQMACATLREFGYQCDCKSVNHSELYVLERLNYIINRTTPIHYINGIVCHLAVYHPGAYANDLLNSSYECLNRVIIHQRDIYKKLYHCLTGNSRILENHMSALHELKYNYLYLAGGIVTAVFIQCKYFPGREEAYMRKVHRICNIKLCHIAAFAYVILETLFPEH